MGMHFLRVFGPAISAVSMLVSVSGMVFLMVYAVLKFAL